MIRNVEAEAPTMLERLAVVVARTLENGEVGWTGLATGDAATMFASIVPIMAMGLARALHAPDFTVLLSGWCHNPDLTKLHGLPNSEFAVDLMYLDCEAQKLEYPGQHAVKRGDIDVGFSSAAQIDRYGNVNSVAIGPRDKPRVRLVGPILQPEHFACFGRAIVMMPHHAARNFVERVDYISGVGHPGGAAGRAALGLSGGGPRLVVTPKCIFDFDHESGEMRVRYLHPGVTANEVREATGFPLRDLAAAEQTPDPTDLELSVLREEVDTHGLLRDGRS